MALLIVFTCLIILPKILDMITGILSLISIFILVDTFDYPNLQLAILILKNKPKFYRENLPGSYL